MRKLKVAQIGVGHDHADCIIRTLKYMSDVFEVVGVAVVPEDWGNAKKEPPFGRDEWAFDGVPRMTVEEILARDDLDGVCIETEDRALTKYALMAAERGLNVHMDKPGGISGEEFDRLVDTMKQTGKVFSLGYMYRYNPAVLKLMDDIRDGKLGTITCVEAQMSRVDTPRKRAWLGNYPGGMLYFLGCHLIDLVCRIQGEPLEVIPLSTCTHIDEVEAEDYGMAVFKYPHGVSFVKTTGVEIGGFERRQLVVCGTNGTVELKPFEWWTTDPVEGWVSPQTTGVREAYERKSSIRGEYHDTEVTDRYIPMLAAFADYIRGTKVNPYDCEYERALHKLILKACGEETK